MGRNYLRQKKNIHVVSYNSDRYFEHQEKKYRSKLARVTMKLISNRKNDDKKKNH